MSGLDIIGLAQSMMGGNARKQDKKDNKTAKKQNWNSDKNYSNKNNSNKENYGYVGAPYNFVPLSEKVYEYPEGTLAMHNDVREELFSGDISYEITAKTPIFIDDGSELHQFYKNSKGQYCIPGSSIRGLIRNNVQILGFSSIFEDIDDYALMYRSVAGGQEKKRYADILGSKQLEIDKKKIGILQNVKAGYIANEDGNYVIYPNKVKSIGKPYKDMNYYVLSERTVVDHYLKWESQNPQKDKFEFSFFTDKKPILTQHLMKKFEKKIIKGRVHYKGMPNPDYKPYSLPVSYLIKNQKEIIAVGKPGEYTNEGYALSSGKMNEKKAIYIIPEIDRSQDPIQIPEKDVTAFKIDLKKRKNALKQFENEEKDFFSLPEEGKEKPVFYIQLGEKLYFGFTPRLRLFYDHTVKEGLKENHKEGIIDYAKAMFGYSNSSSSYKSRLSFSDAVNTEKSAKKVKTEKVILAEPKPTSYLDYLKQDSKTCYTYNTSDFEIRGMKQYWLHSDYQKCDINGKEKAASVINPLSSGTIFSGKVRFQNLTRDELGLLLWSLNLRDESWMNIGKGKAFGYGNISLKITSARVFDKKKAYLSDITLDLEPFDEIVPEEYIAYYKEYISNKLQVEDIEKVPMIRTFVNMKDSTKIPDAEDVRYMKIDKKEYSSNRKVPLPSVDDVLKNKK